MGSEIGYVHTKFARKNLRLLESTWILCGHVLKFSHTSIYIVLFLLASIHILFNFDDFIMYMERTAWALFLLFMILTVLYTYLNCFVESD